MAGELRTLLMYEFQTVFLTQVQQPLNADLFMVISLNWTHYRHNISFYNSSYVTLLSEGLKKRLEPKVFVVQEYNVPIRNRFEFCYENIIREEIRRQYLYDWVVKTRPDVYFHCTVQAFQVQRGWVGAAWDYFVASPREYAFNLFVVNSNCTFHSAVCNICGIKRIFKFNFYQHYKFVDISRPCQLHKSELHKHKCIGFSTKYVKHNSLKCPRFDAPSNVTNSIWSKIIKCKSHIITKK